MRAKTSGERGDPLPQRRCWASFALTIVLAVLATSVSVIGSPLPDVEAQTCGPVQARTGSAGTFELTATRNLRTGPDLDCATMTTLSAGAVFEGFNPEVSNDGFVWNSVTTSSSSTGWLAVRRTDGTNPVTIPSGPTGGSGGCTNPSPGNRFEPPVSRTISHPEFEAKGWVVAFRSGPSMDCGDNIIWASDNQPVTELGTYNAPDQTWSLLQINHNGTSIERWAETAFLEGGGTPGGSGGCTNPSPGNRFEPPVSRTISHPEFEAKGWVVAFRSGPSMDCGDNIIWASDNQPVTELGTYNAPDQTWSLLQINHNGTSIERWAETAFLEGGGTPGGSGGCTNPSPGNRFEPPVSRTISHPEFEAKGWVVAFRSGPSMDCGDNIIWASDNQPVTELGTYNAPDQTWSLLQINHNGTSIERWAETAFLEGGGTPGGSGGCTNPSPGNRFEPPVSRTISHPEFEAKGWVVAFRSGPSMDCGDNIIWASDNQPVTELGTYNAPDQTWSLLQINHNGTSIERWAETTFLEGGGTPGGPGGPVPPIPPPPGGVPIVIFDTDMGPDIDDSLALAALHEYADQGRAHIAAVTLSRNSNTGAEYIDQVNHFYGRPDIPIGVYRNTMGSTGMDSNDRYTRSLVNRRSTYPFDVNSGSLPHGYELMRAVLEASPDNSVVIVQVGFSTNTAELLNRYPDLVRRKARLLSLMAGNVTMPSGAAGPDEFNIKHHASSARIVFDNWPNQLVMSEADLGAGVPYPNNSIENDFNYGNGNHLIKDSYQDPQGTPGMGWHPHPDMFSWDITSVIAAMEPGFIPIVLGPGRIAITSSNGTVFSAGGGNHSILAEGRQLSSTQRSQLISRMTQLVSSPPGGDSGSGCDSPPARGGSLGDHELTTSSRRVRSGPSTACATVTTLSAGAVFAMFDPEVTADGFRWRSVTTAAGTVGWLATVRTDGTNPVTRPHDPDSGGGCNDEPSEPLIPGVRGSVTVGGSPSAEVQVYERPCSGERTVVRTIPRETNVTLTQQSANYFGLASGGWIRQGSFVPEDGGGPPRPTPPLPPLEEPRRNTASCLNESEPRQIEEIDTTVNWDGADRARITGLATVICRRVAVQISLTDESADGNTVYSIIHLENDAAGIDLEEVSAGDTNVAEVVVPRTVGNSVAPNDLTLRVKACVNLGFPRGDRCETTVFTLNLDGDTGSDDFCINHLLDVIDAENPYSPSAAGLYYTDACTPSFIDNQVHVGIVDLLDTTIAIAVDGNGAQQAEYDLRTITQHARTVGNDVLAINLGTWEGDFGIRGGQADRADWTTVIDGQTFRDNAQRKEFLIGFDDRGARFFEKEEGELPDLGSWDSNVIGSTTSIFTPAGNCNSGLGSVNNWSAIGIRDGRYLVMISTDTLQQVSDRYFCEIFGALGVRQAIRMDGAPSASMYAAGEHVNPLDASTIDGVVFGSARHVLYALVASES